MTRASDTARILSGGAVINEDSNDVDFRVESNGNTHALFVDGGNDGVGIGTSSVDTNATMTISNTGDNHALSIVGGLNKSRMHFQGANTGSGSTDGLVIGLSSSDDTNDDSALIGLKESGSMSFQTSNSTRMTIDGAGRVLVGKTSSASNVAGVNFETGGSGFVTTTVHCAFFNRQNDDGNVILIVQGNTTEGTISVSGSTVSYNGGHLSRWSRLLNNSKDETIVKGTVMTNLDEMVEWGDEDNEQLNKMAVSSVEGDANVAGVFVNWDNDDDWNDMNVAMTGDMVIRIAKGTTVARGDLLMSAGDGTAKPQGDDIVRSKTIAKVTSTNVSHTYDDGTYIVP